MSASLTIGTLASIIFFPWQLSVLVVLGGAGIEPLLPLAAGLLADALYFVPHSTTLPVFSLGGAAVSIVATVVRRQFRTGPVRDL
jgi:hypothetical protein